MEPDERLSMIETMLATHDLVRDAASYRVVAGRSTCCLDGATSEAFEAAAIARGIELVRPSVR